MNLALKILFPELRSKRGNEEMLLTNITFILCSFQFFVLLKLEDVL